MSKEEKRAIRAAFRKAVFERDHYRCRVCGVCGVDRQGGDGHLKYHKGSSEELDAHHIVDRHYMPNGGYVAENGISLCSLCHEKAEIYWIDENKRDPVYMPERLYQLIDSSFEQAEIASNLLQS